MRLYEFGDLEHGEHRQVYPSQDTLTITGLKNLILKNCTEILSAMKGARGKMLLRGVEYKPDAFVARTRNDRTTATLGDVTKEIDATFSSVGIKALRKSSIATTSSMGEAGNFGKLYIILPIDGFDFLWSPIVEDFGTMTGGAWSRNDIPNLMQKYNTDNLEELLFDHLKYTDNPARLSQAIASGHEVNIHGNYYGLLADRFWHDIKEMIA